MCLFLRFVHHNRMGKFLKSPSLGPITPVRRRIDLSLICAFMERQQTRVFRSPKKLALQLFQCRECEYGYSCIIYPLPAKHNDIHRPTEYHNKAAMYFCPILPFPGTTAWEDAPDISMPILMSARGTSPKTLQYESISRITVTHSLESPSSILCQVS